MSREAQELTKCPLLFIMDICTTLLVVATLGQQRLGQRQQGRVVFPLPATLTDISSCGFVLEQIRQPIEHFIFVA